MVVEFFAACGNFLFTLGDLQIDVAAYCLSNNGNIKGEHKGQNGGTAMVVFFYLLIGFRLFRSFVCLVG